MHVVKLRYQIIPEATINLCNRSRGQIKVAGSKGNALTSLLSNYYQKFINSKQWLFRKLNTLIFGMLSMVMKRPDKYCGWKHLFWPVIKDKYTKVFSWITRRRSSGWHSFPGHFHIFRGCKSLFHMMYLFNNSNWITASQNIFILMILLKWITDSIIWAYIALDKR